MIVMLDSNVWLKELALNSGAGSALRFFLKKRQAKIALPEVVRLEVQRNLRSRLTEALENIRRNGRELLALFRSMKEIALPTDAEVEALIVNMFSTLGEQLQDVPFCLESARSSLLKTIDKVPPCDQKQEFKDGVIWADCVKLLENEDVVLVTADRAFYQGRNYDQGLAAQLRAEIPGDHEFVIKPSIAHILDHVKTGVDLDDGWFVSAIREKVHPDNQLFDDRGLAESGKPLVRKTLFVTESPDRLFVDYKIELPCTDVSGQGRTNVRWLLEGSGIVDPSKPAIVSVHPGSAALECRNADGTLGRSINVYISGAVVLGHRIVSHEVRHPLESDA